MINFVSRPAALWQARGTVDKVSSVVRVSTYDTDPCDKGKESKQYCMCPDAS